MPSTPESTQHICAPCQRGEHTSCIARPGHRGLCDCQADDCPCHSEEDQENALRPILPTPTTILAKLKKLERNSGRGRTARRGTYQPQLKAELKLLSDLYKLQWMMSGIGRPGREGEMAGEAVSKEVREEFSSAERVIRLLLETGKVGPGVKPATPLVTESVPTKSESPLKGVDVDKERRACSEELRNPGAKQSDPYGLGADPQAE